MFLVPANCVRASKLRFGGNPRPAGDSRWGRRCASGRQSVSGLLLAFGPAKRVWPGKTRLASCSKARFTSKIRTLLHQQGDSPPANTLATSKPTSRKQARSPNAPSHSGAMPTGEQAGPDGTPPKALNLLRSHVRSRLENRHSVRRREPAGETGLVWRV